MEKEERQSEEQDHSCQLSSLIASTAKGSSEIQIGRLMSLINMCSQVGDLVDKGRGSGVVIMRRFL